MAIVGADTSFLFSLYGNDAHTATAHAWARHSRQPLTLTILARYEFENAIRFAAFRKAISRADALASLNAFETDLRIGNLQLPPCDLAAIVAEASRLSALHTMKGGHRSFDILHVAAAVVTRAARFLTLDANQRKLAAALRLEVGP